MKKANRIDEISVKMMSYEKGCFDLSEDLCQMLASLPDINAKGRDGRTVLMHAALYNQLAIAEWLIAHGANIQDSCSLGLTPLHCAVVSKNYQIAQLLLQNGAQINAQDSYGNPPLMRAGHLDKDMITLLLSYGANVELCNNHGICALKLFEAYPDILELLNSKRSK